MIELKEFRCKTCNKLLGKINGEAEVKCPRCGKLNRTDENKIKTERP